MPEPETSCRYRFTLIDFTEKSILYETIDIDADSIDEAASEFISRINSEWPDIDPAWVGVDWMEID